VNRKQKTTQEYYLYKQLVSQGKGGITPPLQMFSL
jgi:hypothetical protein